MRTRDCAARQRVSSVASALMHQNFAGGRRRFPGGARDSSGSRRIFGDPPETLCSVWPCANPTGIFGRRGTEGNREGRREIPCSSLCVSQHSSSAPLRLRKTIQSAIRSPTHAHWVSGAGRRTQHPSRVLHPEAAAHRSGDLDASAVSAAATVPRPPRAPRRAVRRAGRGDIGARGNQSRAPSRCLRRGHQ